MNNEKEESLEIVENDSEVSNFKMMEKISENRQSLEDIKNLTSSKVTDQLKVFLVSQARNELRRVVKLTEFLDRLEDQYIDKVNESVSFDDLTLKQYGEVIGLITDLLARSNDIIYKVLRDDSLMTILNTTIYTDVGSSQVSSVVSSLKDAQSRERVRNVIQTILLTTSNYKDSCKDDFVESGE